MAKALFVQIGTNSIIDLAHFQITPLDFQVRIIEVDIDPVLGQMLDISDKFEVNESSSTQELVIAFALAEHRADAHLMWEIAGLLELKEGKEPVMSFINTAADLLAAHVLDR